MCENPSPHTHHPYRAAVGSTPPMAATAAQRPLRIAIVGKGGVGKTTIAGVLARVLAARGRRVLAIDADPDANLASTLPLDHEEPPVPLAQQRELLQAHTGGAPAGLFLLNPDTGDLLPKGTARWGGGHPLIALGWSKGGGEGCYCDEHALLRRLLNQASKTVADVTLIDSEAGLEHLSRGTIAGADLVLVVVEPGRRSLETAQAVRTMAAGLGIGAVRAVVNGCRGDDELARVLRWLADWLPLAVFPDERAIRESDLHGRPPPLFGEFERSAETLADAVLSLAGGGVA